MMAWGTGAHELTCKVDELSSDQPGEFSGHDSTTLAPLRVMDKTGAPATWITST
jgi:hypothetical protein